jgi:hypothetical protein
MKQIKNIKLFFFLGLFVYSFSFIATSPIKDYDGCQIGMDNYFNRDTSVGKYSFISNLYYDTILINTDTTNPNIINWNAVTDSICAIQKRDCGIKNKPILVINARDTARSTWNNRFGKKIYFKLCP